MKAQIAADRAAGLRPVCVAASAGTVNTGAIDPLDALADLKLELTAPAAEQDAQPVTGGGVVRDRRVACGAPVAQRVARARASVLGVGERIVGPISLPVQSSSPATR